MADAQALRAAEAFPHPPPSAARRRHLGLQSSEFTWAIAFIIPYAAVFLAFVAYQVVYGLGLGRDPALYAELMSEPIYQRTVVNTSSSRNSPHACSAGSSPRRSCRSS